jgi:hypothetical protein
MRSCACSSCSMSRCIGAVRIRVCVCMRGHRLPACECMYACMHVCHVCHVHVHTHGYER